MYKDTIIKWCSEQEATEGILNIPDDMFLSLDEETASYIVDYFKGNTLIKLPTREIEFFDWLKVNDEDVWSDLWDESDEYLYHISIDFLPVLTNKLRGFPICDLLSQPNFYFTVSHIEGKDAELFVDSIKKRFLDKNKLTLEQAILLQISTQPTDIWHFAYHFNSDIEHCKEAVNNLEREKMLIHLTEAEHLIPFIEI